MPRRRSSFTRFIRKNAKAIVAFFAPMLSQLAAALGNGVISPTELVRSLLVSLLTSLVTWAVPNQPS
jgi:hypothetical protein